MKFEEKTKALQPQWSFISFGINSALGYVLAQEKIIWYLPIAIILILTVWGYIWTLGEIRKKNYATPFWGLLLVIAIYVYTIFDKGSVSILDITAILCTMLAETGIYFLIPHRYDILRRVRTIFKKK